MKTLAERIAEAQKKLAAKKDALVELTKQLDETPDDDELLTQLDELTGEVEKSAGTLETLQKAETALKERVEKVEEQQQSAAIIHAKAKDHETKELWLKNAVCAFLAHVNRVPLAQVMEDRYKGNRALQTVLAQKSAVPLATTFNAGWAAELVQTDVQGFVDLMTPFSVAAALSRRTLSINFDGFNSVTIPRRAPRTAGTHLGGAFVGEGGAIPLGRLALNAATLARYKHAVISTFSRELAERSTPSIEQIIRQAVLDDMSMSLDEAFLSDDVEVPGVRPAGIGAGVVPIAGDAGGGIDAVVADIKAALAALNAAGLGTSPVLLANTQDLISVGLMQTALGEFIFRAELAAGNLLGIPVIASQNVALGTAFVVDASTIATAFDATDFNVSDVATVVEANADTTPPTHATGAGGAVGTAELVPRNGGIPASIGAGAAAAGATARSLWQTFSVGIRSVQPVSWGVISPGGVVVLNGLTW